MATYQVDVGMPGPVNVNVGPVNVEVPVVVKQLAALRGQHLHAHTLRILHTSGLNLPVGCFQNKTKKETV